MNTRRNLDPIKTRVNELLAQMTLEEKLAQLGSYYVFELQSGDSLDAQKIESKLKNGIGQISRVGGAGTWLPVDAAKSGNAIQRFLKEKTRLGIPAIIHEECCSGLMAPKGSIFPQMIGLASTFQPELAGEMASVLRQQMLAVGARQGLAPVLDVARDPRWGRVEETFGEDPTLVSQFGAAYIKGLQGDDLTQGVMATGKHFVGHSFSQGGLNCGPVHLGMRDLWDVYLAPFQAAIRDAGLASMMNAYPEIDGEVVAASRLFLTDLLRNTLGFDGVVVSDYEAILMIHNYHRAAATKKEAAIKALTAGIDVEMPTVDCYGDDLLDAVRSGELPLETIDLAVSRHLRKKFELGLFDNPFVDEGKVLEVFDTPEHRDLAYRLACKSMVLLKNDGVLPIQKDGVRLAVIGPNANSSRCMMGDYSYAALVELMQVVPGGSTTFSSLTETDMEALTVPVPTFLEAMQARVPSGMLTYARGCDIRSEDESGFPEAVSTARDADVVILVMGGLSGLAPQCTTGEFRDSTDLGLPGVQEKLVSAILETGKPVVLVLIDGRPAAIPALVEGTNAILEAWVPGEEGAAAIAGVLFGDTNPGGKLPISVPRSAGQVPIFYNHKPSGMRSNIYGDYYNEKVTPLFPFGHGLSYSSFDYSGFEISSSRVGAGGTVEIACTVENTSPIAGEEVVQLYCCDVYASFPRPVKELKGFKRVSLLPGEARTVTFKLPVNMLAFYDANLDLVVEPGTVACMLGSSSEDIRCKGEFEITGDETVKIQDRIFVCDVDVK